MCGEPVRHAGIYCGQACYHANRRAQPIEPRFWSKVEKRGKGGCWLWTGSVFGSLGYGQFMAHGRPQYAHRLSWEMANGPIPDGQHVLHSCDVPTCVNPAHLCLGTHKSNMEDAATKGRLHVSRPNAQRVSDDTVREIRERVAGGMMQAEAAMRYGVSESFVSHVVRGLRRHLVAPRRRSA